MEQENNINDLPVHNINNKEILKDAEMPNKIVDIGGKSYIKVRLWVHELERLTGDHAEGWGDINVDFMTNERIQLLEAKIKKLTSINQDLVQYNHNQVFELNAKINFIKTEMQTFKQSETAKNNKLKSENSELKVQNKEFENKIKKLKIENENLDDLRNKIFWQKEKIINQCENINLEKENLKNQNDQITEELDKSRKQISQLSFLNDFLKLEKNKLKMELDELIKQNESLTHENDLVKKQLKNLKFEVSVKTNIIKETTREQYSAAYRQKTSAFLKDQKEKADLEYKGYLDNINQKNGIIRTLQKEIEELKARTSIINENSR